MRRADPFGEGVEGMPGMSILSRFKLTIDAQAVKINDLEAKFTAMDAKVKALSGEIASLKARLNEQDQYSRRNNVIVKGVPFDKDESAFGVLAKLAKCENVLLSKLEVEVPALMPPLWVLDAKPRSVGRRRVFM